MVAVACDVAVMCADLDASANFYAALGADLEIHDGQEQLDYLFGTLSSLLLTLVPAATPAHTTRNLFWGIEVPCLFTVWNALDAAGFGDRYQLHTASEGSGFLIAFDPDGNRVTVRERRAVDPLREPGRDSSRQN